MSMNNYKTSLSVLAAVLSLAWLAGCKQASQPTVDVVPGSTLPAALPTTTSSAPTQAPAPTGAPASTPEASPLAITVMRAKAYPGSALTVESTLTGGPNYNRYVVSYESGGLRLFGLLTVPTGSKPAGGWPVILLNHGYIPPPEYSTEGSYAAIVAAFAQSGYIVFKPDYRGNGNSPGTPCQVYICPDYVTDSLNALASVRQFQDANPDKIGVWGHSMGGNVTLHELVISHDLKAAVLMAGVVGSFSGILDWWNQRVATGVLTTRNDQQTQQLVQQMVNLHGTPQTNPAFWNAIDPTLFVSDINMPVLIQVGTADEVVPPSFSQGLAAQLQQAGKSVSLHVYPGADHNLSPDTVAAVEEAITFFDQNLK